MSDGGSGVVQLERIDDLGRLIQILLATEELVWSQTRAAIRVTKGKYRSPFFSPQCPDRGDDMRGWFRVADQMR